MFSWPLPPKVMRRGTLRDRYVSTTFGPRTLTEDGKTITQAQHGAIDIPVDVGTPIMAIGGVDMLIPPSALTVLLGSLSGISISKLMLAGVVPGLILSAVFIGYIMISVSLNPSLAPASEEVKT